MDFNKAYNDLLGLWGGKPQSTEKTGTGDGGTGTGGGTGDGGVQIGGRHLRPNEFRKLLEAFFVDNGRLPHDSNDFERWLNK
ncbi:MAG: hypothetical protein AAF456_22025 [Planctomycetota bacterium]